MIFNFEINFSVKKAPIDIANKKAIFYKNVKKEKIKEI